MAQRCNQLVRLSRVRIIQHPVFCERARGLPAKLLVNEAEELLELDFVDVHYLFQLVFGEVFDL